MKTQNKHFLDPINLESYLSKGIIFLSLLVITFQRLLIYKENTPLIINFTFFSDILQTIGILANVLILLAYYKKRLSKFGYGVLTVTLNFPFTVISGMLNAFFHLTFEYIIIVMLVEILIRMLLTLNNWHFAHANLISSLVLIFFLILFFSICHVNLNSGVKSYVLVLVAAHLCLCVFSIFFHRSRRENELLKLDLINNNKNLKEIFDNLEVGILRISRNRRLLINNVAKLFLEQLKVDSIISCLPLINYYSETKSKLSKEKEIIDSLSEDFEHNTFTPLGQIKVSDSFFEISIRIHSNKNKVSFFEFTIQDVTHAVKAKKKETEQNLKGMFLSKMAHEIKNPLINIKQLTLELSSLFYRCRFDLDRLRETEFVANLDKIMVYSDNLVNIFDDFRVFSAEKLDKAKTSQNCNLKEILANLVAMANKNIKIANKEGLLVELRYGQGCSASLLSNPRIIRQVVANLLKNAVKVTNKGKILIEVQLLKEKEGVQEIKISVEDSGCGMSQEKIKELVVGEFPDDSRLYVEQGSKMGLVIIRKLLSILESELTITSKEGKGSRFSFKLKLEAPTELDSLSEKSTFSNLLDETKRDDSPFDANDFKNVCQCSDESHDFLVDSDNNSSEKTIIGDLSDSEEAKTPKHPIPRRSNNCLSRNKLPTRKISSLKLNLQLKTVFLICDDDPVVLRTHKRILEQYFKWKEMEIDICSFEDGVKCLAGVTELYSTGHIILGLIIDETMPFMRGSQTISTFKEMAKTEQLNRFPIVSVTAYFDEQNIANIYAAGADVVLNKPLSFEQIKEALNKLVSRKL